MLEIFLLTLPLGCVAGLLAGLFGLGGGVIIVPALIGLFSRQDFPNEQIIIMAIATSLATIILTATSSVIAHHKLGSIRWNTVFRLSPSILIGAGSGAILAHFISAGLLKWFFISYLYYVGLRMAMQSQHNQSHKKNDQWLDYPIGYGIGLLSSLLGIGGGTLTVPYLVGRQIPMKNAVAISSACGFPIAISGSLVYIFLGWDKILLPEWSFGYIYLPALSGITLCSLLTAPIGAKLANKLPAKKLKRYFSVFIFFIAFKMMFN